MALVCAATLVAGHPQYMLNSAKCMVPLEVGYAMMKGPAQGTSEPGVSISVTRGGKPLALGDSYTPGEVLMLGTNGLSQGGLAMAVSTGNFVETEASRSVRHTHSVPNRLLAHTYAISLCVTPPARPCCRSPSGARGLDCPTGLERTSKDRQT